MQNNYDKDLKLIFIFTDVIMIGIIIIAIGFFIFSKSISELYQQVLDTNIRIDELEERLGIE